MAQILSPYGQKIRPVVEWALGNSYAKGDQCIYSNQVYVANADIPANTSFSVGTSGATWMVAYTPGSNLGVKITQIASGGRGTTLFLMSDGTVHGIQNQANELPYPGSGAGVASKLSADNVFSAGFGAQAMTQVVFFDNMTAEAETGKATWIGIHGQNAYVLFDSGNLWSWGRNDYGTLGVNDSTGNGHLYTPRKCTINAVAIAGGATAAQAKVTTVYINPTGNGRWANAKKTRIVARTADGKVYGCGFNYHGALGIDTVTNGTVGSGVNQSIVGQWQRLAWLDDADTIWNMGQDCGCIVACKPIGGGNYQTWVAGFNSSGQLGTGNTSAVTKGTSVGSWQENNTTTFTKKIKYVGGGFGYGNWLDSNNSPDNTWLLIHYDTGKIRMCGDGTYGTLGQSNTSTVYSPVTITIGGSQTPSVKQISCTGGDPGVVRVLLDNGSLYMWGYNGIGNQGDGTSNTISIPTLRTGTFVDMPFADQVIPGGEYAIGTFARKTDSDGSHIHFCGLNGWNDSVNWKWCPNAGTGVINPQYSQDAIQLDGLPSGPTGYAMRVALPASVTPALYGWLGYYQNRGLVYFIYDTDGNLWAWGDNSDNKALGRDYNWIVTPMRMNPAYL